MHYGPVGGLCMQALQDVSRWSLSSSSSSSFLVEHRIWHTLLWISSTRTEFHYQTAVVSRMTTLLSNRSGRYPGLQARIRQRNEFAIYVPCAGHNHNPNLVGVKAEGCCLEIVKFLDFLQRL